MKKLVLLVASLLVSLSTLILPWSSNVALAASTTSPTDSFQTKDVGTIIDNTTSTLFTAYQPNTSPFYNYDLTDHGWVYNNVSGTAYVSSTPTTGCTAGNTTFDNNTEVRSLSSQKYSYTGYTHDGPGYALDQQIETNDVILVNGTTAYYWGFRPHPGTSLCTLQYKAVKFTVAPASVGGGPVTAPIGFDWTDAATIQNATGTNGNNTWTYSLVPGSNPLQFNTTSTFGTGSDQQGVCTDYIQVPTIGSPNGTYIYRDTSNRQPTSSGSGQNTNFTFSQPSGVPVPVDSNGCYGFKFDIKLDPAGSTKPAGSSGSVKPDCDVGSYTWIICPGINFINQGITLLFNDVIEPLLQVNPITADNPLHSLWQALLYIANIFFVLIFMLIIFGQAFGLQNYSVKKILPRLIAAAVLIQFSYLIGGIIIDIGNVAGNGVMSLLGTIPIAHGVASIKDSNSALNVLGTICTTLIAGAAVAVFGIGIVGFAILSIVICVGTLVVTLVIRQVLLALLVVAAPLAFAAWVLPNTEQYFKLWAKNIVKLTLMFPLVMFIIGVSALIGNAGLQSQDYATIAAATPNVVPANENNFGTFITHVLLSLASVFGFLAAAKAAKWSGSIMSAVGGAVQKRGMRAASAAGKQVTKPAKSMAKAFGANRAASKATRLGNLAASGGRIPGLKGIRKKTAGLQAGYGLGVGTKGTQQRYSNRINAARDANDKTEQAAFARGFKDKPGTAFDKAMTTKNPNELRAAINQLSADGRIEDLEKVLQQQVGGNTQDPRWKSAISDSKADLAKSSPHLTAPNMVKEKDAQGKETDRMIPSSPYHSMSADAFSNLGKRGWEQAAEAHKNGSVEQKQQMVDELDRLNQNGNFRGRINATNQKTFDDLRTSGTPTRSQIPVPTVNVPIPSGPPTRPTTNAPSYIPPPYNPGGGNGGGGGGGNPTPPNPTPPQGGPTPGPGGGGGGAPVPPIPHINPAGGGAPTPPLPVINNPGGNPAPAGGPTPAPGGSPGNGGSPLPGAPVPAGYSGAGGNTGAPSTVQPTGGPTINTPTVSGVPLGNQPGANYGPRAAGPAPSANAAHNASVNAAQSSSTPYHGPASTGTVAPGATPVYRSATSAETAGTSSPVVAAGSAPLYRSATPNEATTAAPATSGIPAGANYGPRVNIATPSPAASTGGRHSAPEEPSTTAAAPATSQPIAAGSTPVYRSATPNEVATATADTSGIPAGANYGPREKDATPPSSASTGGRHSAPEEPAIATAAVSSSQPTDSGTVSYRGATANEINNSAVNTAQERAISGNGSGPVASSEAAPIYRGASAAETGSQPSAAEAIRASGQATIAGAGSTKATSDTSNLPTSQPVSNADAKAMSRARSGASATNAATGSTATGPSAAAAFAPEAYTPQAPTQASTVDRNAESSSSTAAAPASISTQTANLAAQVVDTPTQIANPPATETRPTGVGYNGFAPGTTFPGYDTSSPFDTGRPWLEPDSTAPPLANADPSVDTGRDAAWSPPPGGLHAPAPSQSEQTAPLTGFPFVDQVPLSPEQAAANTAAMNTGMTNVRQRRASEYQESTGVVRRALNRTGLTGRRNTSTQDAIRAIKALKKSGNAGNINPQPSGGNGLNPRRSPRISERLVDPRVEGDIDDRLS